MIANKESQPVGNRLLARLPAEEFELLRPHLELVKLSHGDPLIRPGEPIRHIYFPVNMLASLVSMMRDGSAAESGSVGREGMVGVPVLLDAGTTAMPTFCQVPGEAFRVRADVVKDLYEDDRGVRKLLNRYIHTVIVNGSHSAACNRLHSLEERLCRWLLMSSDGVGSDEVALTHEFLAVMLGVRRAGVTEAAVKMKEAGLITYKRGDIQILDREGLEAESCECYERTKAEYGRLFIN